MTLTPETGCPPAVTRIDNGLLNAVLIPAPWLLPPLMASVSASFDSVKSSGEFVAPASVAVTL